jgi:hypothetical protein
VLYFVNNKSVPVLIAKSIVKDRQIQLVINEVTERVLKSTLLDLLVEEDRDKLTLRIGVGLVFCHVSLLLLSWLSGQMAGFT